LDRHGQTHTRTCNVCSVDLIEQQNWTLGNKKKSVYFCRTCDNTKRKYNALKQKANYIGSTALKAFNKVKEGYVYILVNPAYPDWVKIGMAVDAEDRCKSYQTGDPFRSYKMVYTAYSKDKAMSENKAHKAAEAIAERRGEWFRMSVGQAKECIQHGL